VKNTEGSLKYGREIPIVLIWNQERHHGKKSCPRVALEIRTATIGNENRWKGSIGRFNRDVHLQ
jgi:hypothetical protein